jgi:hypothetical protein
VRDNPGKNFELRDAMVIELTQYIVDELSVEAFKSRLDLHWKDIQREGFISPTNSKSKMHESLVKFETEKLFLDVPDFCL